MAVGPDPRPIRPTLAFEQALRLAASGHREQVRKGSSVPYVEHPVAVSWILDRSGFDEDVVIAGLLHDLVEDNDVTLDQVRASFGDQVAAIVDACTEVKLDAEGRKRPWPDRKRDHVETVQGANDDTKAVVLADKQHNLLSIQLDLAEKREVWATFQADRGEVLRYYYEAMLGACESADPKLGRLRLECNAPLVEVAWPVEIRGIGPLAG